MAETGVPPDDDMSLVQIGRVQTEPAMLAGPGAALTELLAAHGPDDAQIPAEQMRSLPVDGWRVIGLWPSRGNRDHSEVLAAPLPGQESAWALIMLGGRTGHGDGMIWADPGPLPVYPGRAARRQGLRLTWPRPVIEQPDASPVSLTINLQNTRTETWRNEAGDAARVAGWLLDSAGHRIQASPYVVWSGRSALPDLEPGQVISLPVSLFTPDIPALPAGRYELDAVLTELNLRAEPGSLWLNPDRPPERPPTEDLGDLSAGKRAEITNISGTSPVSAEDRFRLL